MFFNKGNFAVRCFVSARSWFLPVLAVFPGGSDSWPRALDFGDFQRCLPERLLFSLFLELKASRAIMAAAPVFIIPSSRKSVS